MNTLKLSFWPLVFHDGVDISHEAKVCSDAFIELRTTIMNVNLSK